MSEFIIAGGDTSAQAREYAKKEGLEVKAPTPYQLFIDIDSERDFIEFDRNYGIVDAIFGILGYTVTNSRNKPDGNHIIVNLKHEVTPTERCLLQAILGSNRRREGRSLCRIKNGDSEPTLFFEKK